MGFGDYTLGSSENLYGKSFKERPKQEGQLRHSEHTLSLLQAFYLNPHASEFGAAPQTPSELIQLNQEVKQGKTLREAFASLNPHDQKSLKSKVGEDRLETLFSISENRRTPRFWQEIMGFTRDLKRSFKTKDLLMASMIYGEIVKGERGITEEIQREAELEHQAIIGDSSDYRRREILLGRGLGTATDMRIAAPAVFAPMLGQAANTYFKGVQAFSRVGLGMRWFNAGLTGRTLAGAGSFSLETFAFAQGGRLLFDLTEGGVPWGPEDMILSTYGAGITLLGLKGFGFLGNQLYARAFRVSELITGRGLGSLSQATIQQTSGYLGLVGVHHIEERAGLINQMPNGNPWLDALETHGVLFFGMGGAKTFLGPRLWIRNHQYGLQGEMYYRGDLTPTRPKTPSMLWERFKEGVANKMPRLEQTVTPEGETSWHIVYSKPTDPSELGESSRPPVIADMAAPVSSADSISDRTSSIPPLIELAESNYWAAKIQVIQNGIRSLKDPKIKNPRGVDKALDVLQKSSDKSRLEGAAKFLEAYPDAVGEALWHRSDLARKDLPFLLEEKADLILDQLVNGTTKADNKFLQGTLRHISENPEIFSQRIRLREDIPRELRDLLSEVIGKKPNQVLEILKKKNPKAAQQGINYLWHHPELIYSALQGRSDIDPALHARITDAVRGRGKAILDSLGSAWRSADSFSAQRCLAFAKNNPRVVAEALIGRGAEFDETQLGMLAQVVNPTQSRLHFKREIKRVLVANRGEIALSVAENLLQEGVIPIITYSDSDAKQSFVRRARKIGAEVVGIGGQTKEESYLNIPKLIEVAKEVQADAVHPGYGFKSEDSGFGEVVFSAGLVWMGPSVEALGLAGSKAKSKKIFKAAGIPVVPGTDAYQTAEELIAAIKKDGVRFPARMKATAGGSGLGQGNAESFQEVERKFGPLFTQSENAFGVGDILAEQLVEVFQHVELQGRRDRFGNTAFDQERECTYQINGSKLVEIHPATIFSTKPELKARLMADAKKAMDALDYVGIGTVEFMVNPYTGEYFILEVNARIQVERRVTELVTGIKLVREQLRIARGLPLSEPSKEAQGAAVQVRLHATAPGRIDRYRIFGTTDFKALEKQGIYVGNNYEEGDTPNNHMVFNSGLIQVKKPTRAEAIKFMREVLANTVLESDGTFKSNLPSIRQIIGSRAALGGYYTNKTLPRMVELGGEDLANYPFNDTTMVAMEGLAPIHLEVGSHYPLPKGENSSVGPSRLLRETMGALLNGEDQNHVFRFHGPVADLLRKDSELLKAVSDANPNRKRRIWAQSDAEGYLRQWVVFENNRPVRILLFREDVNDFHTKHFTYDFDLKRIPPSGTIYFDGPWGIEKMTSQSLEPFPLPADPRDFNFAGLRLHLFPSEEQTALEIRDFDNALLASLSPDHVIENPAQRLMALFTMSQQEGIPNHMVQDFYKQARQIVKDLSRLEPENELQRDAIKLLGTTKNSLITPLLKMGQDAESPQDWHFLDEVMAWREVVGHKKRNRVLSYHPVEGGKSSAVLYQKACSNGEPAPLRLMVRAQAPKTAKPMKGKLFHRGPSQEDLLVKNLSDTLTTAFNTFDRKAKEFPEVEENVIQILLPLPEDAPELAKTLPEIMGKRLNFIRLGRVSVRGRAVDDRIKRVTFAVIRGNEYPDYFTFRHKKDEQGNRTGEWEEDTGDRGIHPMLGHYIESDRLRLFDQDRDNEHSDRFNHLIYGKKEFVLGKNTAVDSRLFTRVLVPSSEVLRETGQIKIPALERQLDSSTQAIQGSLKKERVKPPPQLREIFFHLQSELAVREEELIPYLERLMDERVKTFRDIKLQRLALKANLLDSKMPEGSRTVLVRFNKFEAGNVKARLDYVVEARVREESGRTRKYDSYSVEHVEVPVLGESRIINREVIVTPEVFETWRNSWKDPSFYLEAGQTKPADQPIRPGYYYLNGAILPGETVQEMADLLQEMDAFEARARALQASSKPATEETSKK